MHQALGEKNIVKVIWFPGHAGNEKANVLAKRGAANVQDPHSVNFQYK